jgi:hypothetical protein
MNRSVTIIAIGDVPTVEAGIGRAGRMLAKGFPLDTGVPASPGGSIRGAAGFSSMWSTKPRKCSLLPQPSLNDAVRGEAWPTGRAGPRAGTKPEGAACKPVR